MTEGTPAPSTDRVDPRAGELGESVVEAVADRRDRDPTELSPLTTVLDPDALDEFVREARSAPRPAAVTVAFRYEGVRVEVDGRGRIRVD